ncbi:MAG TPA: nucleotidyltransferase domain-containing protein [Dehalococcoidia bacterium]|nr:nucleotidyltransferase domain-containing protein [Dehalococcoidia bacterium]
MSNLPRVTLTELPDEERAVAQALIDALGDDLTALAWQGSYARGEAHAESDHDLFVVMRQLDSDMLGKLASVFRGRDAHWSSYIKTGAELRNLPTHGRCQYHFGMSLIHGDFEQPPLERENLLADLRYFASEVAHEARYRVIHAASPDQATDDPARHGRILHYRAKMAVLAMKSRELLHGRDYPLTREDLSQRITDDLELAIIDVVDLWPEFKALYEADFLPLALLLNRFVNKLIAELPAE